MGSNFSFAAWDTWCIQEGCDDWYTCNQETKKCEKTEVTNNPNENNLTNSCSKIDNERIDLNTDGSCPQWYSHDGAWGLFCCNPNPDSTNSTTTSTTSTTCTKVMGIECCEDQLVNGQCKLNIYDTLGIRKSVRNSEDPTSVGLFVQDIVLSATFFIGTLVTIALIVSGLMFIFAASSGKDPANAKKWIMWSLIGLLIVVSSYVIIRLVQYIAKGF